MTEEVGVTRAVEDVDGRVVAELEEMEEDWPS